MDCTIGEPQHSDADLGTSISSPEAPSRRKSFAQDCDAIVAACLEGQIRARQMFRGENRGIASCRKSVVGRSRLDDFGEHSDRRRNMRATPNKTSNAWTPSSSVGENANPHASGLCIEPARDKITVIVIRDLFGCHANLFADIGKFFQKPLVPSVDCHPSWDGFTP